MRVVVNHLELLIVYSRLPDLDKEKKMLRTVSLLGRSPYAVFMMSQKTNPALQGLTGKGARAKKTAQLYRALSKTDLAALKKKAAELPSFVRKTAEEKEALRRRLQSGKGRSPYAVFLMSQKDSPALKGLKGTERAKKTAQLYRALSKTDLAALKKKAAELPSFPRKPKTPKKKKIQKESDN